jgi:glycerophosphoryl diester phosphodiesterase
MVLVLALILSGAVGAETKACAHRGDNKCAPENTLPAVKSAVAKGAPMIEFDVQVTKDGQLVVIHDADVKRTTNGKGKVTELTFDEIRSLDAGSWFGASFSGTRIPTPRELLEVIPHSIVCNVHLKAGAGLGAKTAALVKDMGRLDHCVLACDEKQAAEARAVVPEVKICNMSRQLGSRQAYVDDTIERKADYLQFLSSQGLEGLAEDITKLHARGVKVNWFGTEDPALIRKLAGCGADYILTNDLSLCLSVLDEKTTRPVAMKEGGTP